MKTRQLLIEESNKTACHYVHLCDKIHVILCWPKLHPILHLVPAGPLKTIKSCTRVFRTAGKHINSSGPSSAAAEMIVEIYAGTRIT